MSVFVRIRSVFAESVIEPLCGISGRVCVAQPKKCMASYPYKIVIVFWGGGGGLGGGFWVKGGFLLNWGGLGWGKRGYCGVGRDT